MKKLVDNFNVVCNLVDTLKEPEDDFFYVEVIIRPKYHGGKIKHNINVYFSKGTAFKVKNSQELLNIKDKIINFCTTYNARAYMCQNPCSTSVITDYIKSLHNPIYEDKKEFEKIFENLPRGGYGVKPENFIYQLVDIDSNNKNIWQETRQKIERYNIPIEMEYETPSNGYHYLINIKSLNVNTLEKFYTEITSDKVSIPTIAKILLYSNLENDGYTE